MDKDFATCFMGRIQEISAGVEMPSKVGVGCVQLTDVEVVVHSGVAGGQAGTDGQDVCDAVLVKNESVLGGNQVPEPYLISNLIQMLDGVVPSS